MVRPLFVGKAFTATEHCSGKGQARSIDDSRRPELATLSMRTSPGIPFVRRSILAIAAVLGLIVLPAGDPLAAPRKGHGAGGCRLVAVDGTSPIVAPASRPARATAPSDTVRVDLAGASGSVNPNLTGVVWNAGSSVAPLAPVHPSLVRNDGSLQSRSRGPGQLDLQPLLDRVAQVRAIGAEPLVILSYMPRWLGEPRATAGQDPTRMGPYDLDAWQDLITQVVRALATAPQPAYRFEVWNEPDIFVFWLDTPAQFVATALRTHQAVADVKRETGLPLEVGGPAAAFGLNANMLEYLRAVAAAGLPLDFVSWHNYANFPFLGPDGPEGNLAEEIYRALAKRNPEATPLRYSAEIADIRTKVGAAVAGSGLSPKLSIDEWNVSAGGYDVRHDSAEGASLVAGTLVEMERAGLDDAAFYRAVSGGENHVGDWGLVYADGTPKPSWWVFRAWSTLMGSRLATSGDDATTGLWARATRDRGCVSVLLSNFVATGAPARTVEVDFKGKLPRCKGKRTTTLATLDGSSTTLANARILRLRAHRVATVPMASQSVALVQVGCSR
jgi:xylan 1,4-beta-xylosidase